MGRWSRDPDLNPGSSHEILGLGANHSTVLGLVFFQNWNGFLPVFVSDDEQGIERYGTDSPPPHLLITYCVL